jgi:hypothetical protein
LWVDAVEGLGRKDTDEKKAGESLLELGGPVQNLSKFQMVPIPFLSDLTCSTHSPYDILKV